MTEFTTQAVELIRGIPAGRVMSYGQIAAKAGSPRAARQVVRILHALSEKYDLPWHRVVNARGRIGIGEPVLREMQMQLLRGEGVPVTPEGEVDLARYRHEPIA